MFDHVGLNVRDYRASRDFYLSALEPLGWTVSMEFDQHKAVAFGPTDKPELWIVEREPFGTGTHVALPVDDRALVDAFHAAALAAGGRDNGPPGLREHYHPTYYAAFVLDPDDNNLEVVCHTATS